MSPGLTSLLQDYRIKWSGKELLNKRGRLPRGRIILRAVIEFSVPAYFF